MTRPNLPSFGSPRGAGGNGTGVKRCGGASGRTGQVSGFRFRLPSGLPVGSKRNADLRGRNLSKLDPGGSATAGAALGAMAPSAAGCRWMQSTPTAVSLPTPGSAMEPRGGACLRRRTGNRPPVRAGAGGGSGAVGAAFTGAIATVRANLALLDDEPFAASVDKRVGSLESA